MFLSIVLFFLFVRDVISVRPVDNICQHPPGRRIYIDLGESGGLTAFNVSSPSAGYSVQSPGRTGPGPPIRANLSSHQQCAVELVTCPSCVIRVVFRQLNLSHQCGGRNLVMDSPCRCDYVWLSEPPYDDLPGQQFCGVVNNNSSDEPALIYETKTRTLSIALLYSENHRQAFTLSYQAKRNREIVSVNPRGQANSTGTISSPFFPARYPRDLASEYLLNCSGAPDCRVRLIFTDFQIGAVSFLEFYDGQSRRIDVASGLSFRPPVIISTGPTLSLRFYANGGTGLGFKAIYSFITGSYDETAVKPKTDCGGYVEDFGGAITMMNMVADGVRSYDCVWLIRPPENFLHLKTHLFLKIANFLDFAGNTELQVRQGLTSDQPVLETLRYPASQFHLLRAKEHIVPVNIGFYVRLKGSFNTASRLAISYAAFSYNKCFPGSEFLCANHRCISGKLSCDSFDHCGDNSDEPVSCFQEWGPVLGDRHWSSQTPNYFFPKTDRYADLKTATLVFLVSSLGLVVLISALIILLYRMNSRARQQRELHSHLQTISELLADNGRIEELIPDEPPDYEPPPEYEDIMKAPPSSTSRRKRRVSRHSTRRSRSSPGERRRGSRGTPVPVLEVVLPAERLPRPTHLQPHSNHQRRSSNLSMVSSVSTSEILIVSTLPDSPPPPYSPTNSQALFFSETPVNIPDTPVPETSDAPLIPEPPTTWCVTAVTTPSDDRTNPNFLETDLVNSRTAHRRSQSCGDVPNEPEPNDVQRRLVQSNPLTPFESPILERPPMIMPPLSPTTDSDVYLFSSLESNDFNSPFIKCKDVFDWEEFDKQFPGRKGCDSVSKGSKVTQLLKIYDGFLFRGEQGQCSCEGACGCGTSSANDVWGSS